MEWWLVLLLYLGLFLIIMASGMPLAFAFMVINFLGIYLWMGSLAALTVPVSSALSILSSYSLVPVPLFIIMGEVLFHSGLARSAIEVVDKWIGHLPGRLGIVTILVGGLFGAISGSALASGALIGKNMTPEMKRKGWDDRLSIGCVLGSAGLALLIPPSTFAVVFGAVAKVSIEGLLMAILIPGLVMMVLMALYVVLVSIMRPEIAPRFEVRKISLIEKIRSLGNLVAPTILIFLVTATIYFGIATPTESAALGAIGSIIIAAIYGGLNWEVLKKAFSGAVKVTGMIMLIVAGSTAFSEFLALTGSSRGLVRLAAELDVPSIAFLIIMQLIVFILGCFIDEFSIMMLTIPIFIPIATTLGWDPIWFGTITIIILVTGLLTPPFGLLLYTIKGVLPDVPMQVIYRGAIPFVMLQLLTAALVIVFPKLALWIPSIIK